MPSTSHDTVVKLAVADLNVSKLAVQTIGGLEQLAIDEITFWDCCSVGLAARAQGIATYIEISILDGVYSGVLMLKTTGLKMLWSRWFKYIECLA